MTQEPYINPVFKAIRKMLPAQLLVMPFLYCGIPTQPRQVPFLEGAPTGLRRLHTAASVPEAELLTQVLIEAGFHIEYVPAITTGIFGMTGNNTIYVTAAEYAEAAEFLREYLNPHVQDEPLE